MSPYVSVSQWVVTVDFCPQIKAGIEPANPSPLFNVGVAVGCLCCTASRKENGVRSGFVRGHAHSHRPGTHAAQSLNLFQD